MYFILKFGHKLVFFCKNEINEQTLVFFSKLSILKSELEQSDFCTLTVETTV